MWAFHDEYCSAQNRGWSEGKDGGMDLGILLEAETERAVEAEKLCKELNNKIQLAKSLFDFCIETKPTTVHIERDKSIFKHNQIEIQNHSSKSIKYEIFKFNKKALFSKTIAALEIKGKHGKVSLAGEDKEDSEKQVYDEVLGQGDIHGKVSTVINIPDSENKMFLHAVGWDAVVIHTVRKGDVMHLLPPNMVELSEKPGFYDESRRDLLNEAHTLVRKMVGVGPTNYAAIRPVENIHLHFPSGSKEMYGTANIILGKCLEENLLSSSEGNFMQRLIVGHDKAIADVMAGCKLAQQAGASCVKLFASSGRRMARCESKVVCEIFGTFDIHDGGQDIVIIMDLPGATKVGAQFEDKDTAVLIISGTREKLPGQKNRFSGDFKELIDLNAYDIIQETTDISLGDGMLEINIKRRAPNGFKPEVKPRKPAVL